jgi:hypothetical protein
MISLQLSFRRSTHDEQVYCCVTQNNTNFQQWSETNGLSGVYSAGSATGIVAQVEYLLNSNCNTNSLAKYSNKGKVNYSVKIAGYVLPQLIQSVFEVLSGTQTIGVFKTTMYGYSITLKTPELIGTSKLNSLEYTYTRPGIVEMLMAIPLSNVPNMASEDMKTESGKGKKIYSCELCRRPVGDKKSLTEHTSSIGDKVLVCSECNHIKPCSSCGFKELTYLLKYTITIDSNTGANQKVLTCRKCRSVDYAGCSHCGCYYTVKEYSMCPCRIPMDFKSQINAHNADVLQYYPKDAYCNELFGVEIEAGTLNKNRKLFQEIASTTNELVADNAILKYDSSIDWINKAEQVPNDYKGFEVVTRPMIYKNTMRFLKDFCKNRHPLLRSWEVGTCGLHIHVSKACLRPFEVGKILIFINSKGNKNFVKMIAKREDKKFAKFVTKKITDYRKSTPTGNGVTQEHYESVNTSKLHTIEFRIFRGTLNIQTVVSYLQFVKSLIDFVKVTQTSDLTHTKYVEYLFSTEKSKFRELKERIQSENTKEIIDRGEI